MVKTDTFMEETDMVAYGKNRRVITCLAPCTERTQDTRFVLKCGSKAAARVHRRVTAASPPIFVHSFPMRE